MGAVHVPFNRPNHGWFWGKGGTRKDPGNGFEKQTVFYAEFVVANGKNTTTMINF